MLSDLKFGNPARRRDFDLNRKKKTKIVHINAGKMDGICI